MQRYSRPTATGQSAPPFRVPGAEQRAQPPAHPSRPPGGAPQDAPVHEEGLYIISVAARILHMHPQTLRKYERVGLVRPSRTVGMLRLYSERDIAKLRMIKHLVDERRLNLAGVEMALAVFDRLTAAMEAAQAPVARPRPAASPFEEAMREIIEMFLGAHLPSSRRRGEQ